MTTFAGLRQTKIAQCGGSLNFFEFQFVVFRSTDAWLLCVVCVNRSVCVCHVTRNEQLWRPAERLVSGKRKPAVGVSDWHVRRGSVASRLAKAADDSVVCDAIGRCRCVTVNCAFSIQPITSWDVRSAVLNFVVILPVNCEHWELFGVCDEENWSDDVSSFIVLGTNASCCIHPLVRLASWPISATDLKMQLLLKIYYYFLYFLPLVVKIPRVKS